MEFFKGKMGVSTHFVKSGFFSCHVLGQDQIRSDLGFRGVRFGADVIVRRGRRKRESVDGGPTQRRI